MAWLTVRICLPSKGLTPRLLRKRKAEALHEIGKGQVAVGIEPLGAGYLLVVVDIVVGAEGADKLQHGILGMRIQRYQTVRHDEGTGIDERVAGQAVLVLELYQGVERVAGGLAPHRLPYIVPDAPGHHS